MKVNLVELTDSTKRKTKKELIREFVGLANIFLRGDKWFNKFYKSDIVRKISFEHQNAVLNLQRTKLVGDYISYNGFNDKEQKAIFASLDSFYGNNIFSTRIRKGLHGQIKALERELDYVDKYKYSHMNWNQTPILRASLPC